MSKLKKLPRKKELEKIRSKILEAIRYSKRYWLIFKENTFGLATIIDLVYKRSYIEILFFTNSDVIKRGVPLLKINTPIETEVDLNEIILNPDFDSDGLVSPLKIIKRINEVIDIEYKKHLNVLNQEVNLLNNNFENYIVEGIPYFREIFIYFPDFYISFKINFEQYPLPPRIYFSDNLSKIIEIGEFLKRPIITNWNELKPPHIVDIPKALVNLIVQKLNIRELFKDSQLLIFDNVSISKKIRNINFKILRGDSLGIYYKTESQIAQKKILKLFQTLKFENQDFSGKIKLFGKYIQLERKTELERIHIIPQAVDSRINKMKLKKAVKFNIDVKLNLEESNPKFQKLMKNAGLLTITEEWRERGPLWRILSKVKKFREKRKMIDKILSITGLLNKKNKKFSEVTPLDYFLFFLARAILQDPLLIMFSIPNNLLNRLQYDKFNNYIKKIKESFHIPIILHGPQEIVSKCDKILAISEKQTFSGTFEELHEDTSQKGEVITIELDHPSQEELNRMYNLESILIKEERKSEKYKIYPRDDPKKIIQDLIEIFGINMFNFRKYQISLSEFTEFIELQS